MAITATALLKIANLAAPPGMRAQGLSDATLLHTGASFASEPEALWALLQAALGDALAAHLDPRGVLFIPDVMAPKARSYTEVVEEVGEGGLWARAPQGGEDEGFALPEGLGALSAMLGSVMQQMPASVLDAAEAAAHGDAAAFRAVGEQVAAMLGQANSPLHQLTALLGASGIDASSASLQQLLPKLEAEFARDPGQLQQLAERLFAGGELPDEEEDA